MTDSDLPAENPTPAENQALPLEELELTPQWVKSSGKSYADHSGTDRGARRSEGRRPEGDRRRGNDRDQRPRSPRPTESGERRGPPRPEQRRSGPSGPPPQQRRDVERRPAPSAPPTLPIEVTFQPEDKGFAAMIEAMKHNQRAYTLFDIAKLVLNKPERHMVKFSRKPAASGAPEPLFLVMPGEHIFLRQDEAVRRNYCRRGRHSRFRSDRMGAASSVGMRSTPRGGSVIGAAPRATCGSTRRARDSFVA